MEGAPLVIFYPRVQMKFAIRLAVCCIGGGVLIYRQAQSCQAQAAEISSGRLVRTLKFQYVYIGPRGPSLVRLELLCWALVIVRLKSMLTAFTGSPFEMGWPTPQWHSDGPTAPG